MFLLADFFSLILLHFFSLDFCFCFQWLFGFLVGWLGFFCSSLSLTPSLSSISSLPGLGVEICLLSTRSPVGGQEHVKGQAGGRRDLKASPG